MKVEVATGGVLAQRADVLICSANIYLNLSGGVGGEILRRFGDATQRDLHAHLTGRGLKFVQPGEIVETNGLNTGFKVVIHAVAVDAWYHTSASLVAQVLRESFARAAANRAATVSVCAVGTGYGRLSMTEFAHGLREALAGNYPGVELIRNVVRTDSAAEQIRSVLGAKA